MSKAIFTSVVSWSYKDFKTPKFQYPKFTGTKSEILLYVLSLTKNSDYSMIQLNTSEVVTSEVQRTKTLLSSGSGKLKSCHSLL